MWNLLAPFVSGAFGLAGANQAAASNARAARLNAIFQAQQNAQNIALQQETNASSRRMAWNMMKFQSKKAGQLYKKTVAEADKDRQIQKDFAQQGVKWRVDDAKAAGIHPLAALGAQLSTSSPISISGNVASGSVPSQTAPQNTLSAPYVGDVSTGNALAAMGQDISRAMTATATQSQRDLQYTEASRSLSLENQSLQNQLLSAQIARTRGAAVGPAFPSVSRYSRKMDGQGNSVATSRASVPGTGLVEPQPHKPVGAAPGVPSAEPGEVTDIGYSRTSTGWAPQPSKDTKERIEDDIIGEINWHLRNRLPQTLGINLRVPAHVKLKPHEEWWWNTGAQEYQIRSKRPPSYIPRNTKGNDVPFWQDPTLFQ